MDVRALIMVGGRGPNNEGRLAGVPIAFLDVLGESVLQRVISRLEHFGVSAAAVVTDTKPPDGILPRSAMRPGLRWEHATGTHFWRTAENVFSDFSQNDSDLVLAIRLGPYAEIEIEEALQFHLDRHCRVTSLLDENGMPLDWFVISSSRRNDAAYLFRHELKEMRVPCDELRFSGYINPLKEAADLRRMALDGFAGIAKVAPNGTEIKAGVWVGENAQVHRKARLLAPCFVGANARIRSCAVLTRASVVEHHSVVDCGTVIENSSVMPMVSIGAGLDVSQSLVGFRHIWNFKRKIEVSVPDQQLIGSVSSAPLRALKSAAQVALYFPKVIAQAVLSRHSKPEPKLPEAVRRPAAALKTTERVPDDGLAATDLLPARRYGNE